MKPLLVTLVAGLALSAQTPPPAKTAVPAKAPVTAKPAAKPAAKPVAPAGPNRALLNPALLKAKAPENFKTKFTTTKGDFVLECHRAWAPLGVDRFYNLVKNGFFTDTAFFRVLPGFVAQFGLNPFPAVNQAWEKARIADDPVTQSNKKGYITFATAGPNTRTTQLFINLVDNPRLDQMGFSAFGEVTEGMDVVEKFYSGYGEGAPGGAGPAQDRIVSEGKTYLDKSFPLLDSVKSAKLVVEAPPAKPAAKPAVAPVKKVAPAVTAPKPAAK